MAFNTDVFMRDNTNFYNQPFPPNLPAPLSLADLERTLAAMCVSPKPQTSSKKGAIESSLDFFSQGIAVDEQIAYIASVLFNEEMAKFHEYTPREQQAFVLLLLSYWQKTGKVKYLDLLHYVLPYCLEHVDAICSKALVMARAQSNELFAATLAQTVRDFLALQDHECQQNNAGCENFKRLLKFIHINDDLHFIAEALCAWENSYRLHPHQMATAVEFFVDITSKMKATQEDTQQAACELICQLLNKIDDSEFCLGVLYQLFCKEKDRYTEVQWSQTLEKGPILRLFANIVNSKNYPARKRRSFMEAYLDLQAPVNALAVAARLIPSISSSDANMLCSKLSWCIKNKEAHPPLKLFIRNILILSDERITKLKHLFLKLSPLLKKLEMEVRRHPEHPGRNFLLDIARSQGFNGEARNSLYTVWLDRQSPAQCLMLAALILKSEETNQIHLVTNRLLERLIQQPNCPHLEYFCWYVRTEQYDPDVKNAMITFLLNLNTPAALLFVTKLCGPLPLSAVWLLLKKIERCSPLDEQARAIQKEAFSCLLSATWYFDPRESSDWQTWYKKRGIVFYTLFDEPVHDLLDKLEAVSRILDASHEHTKESLRQRVVYTFVTERKRLMGRPKKREPLLRKIVLRLDPHVFLRAKAGEDFRVLTVQSPPQHEAFEEIPRPDSPELTEEN